MKNKNDFCWWLEKVKHPIKTVHELVKLTKSKYLLRDYHKNAERYWDFRAKDICESYKSFKDDFSLIEEFINRYKPQTLLDIGCGHGRHFPLYKSVKVVVGTDISDKMLKLCPQHPNIFLKRMKIEEMDFPENFFDAVISNMVLEHIPPKSIREVISKIVYSCRRAILINEYTGGDICQYEFSHNYKKLFKDAGDVKLVHLKQMGESTMYIFEKIRFTEGAK